MRAIAIVGLMALAGCSASPPAPVDTCGELATVAVCAPSLSPDDLELASRIFGAYQDCDDPNAVPIEVVELPQRVGEAYLNTGVVRVAPRAWEHPDGSGLTIAHELGHVLGYAHENNPCALMAPNAPPGACGAVLVEGCEFVF